jgi:hypothetical protein
MEKQPTEDELEAPRKQMRAEAEELARLRGRALTIDRTEPM